MAGLCNCMQLCNVRTQLISLPIFFVSGCNRTYYGNLGITYDLELHRPKEDKIPYVCELNFTAAAGIHGDIIQVRRMCYVIQ